MIGGLVLAAGESSRMGRPKAALPVGPGGETALSLAVKALLGGGVPGVAVVAGAHTDAVRAALPSGLRGVHVIAHSGWRGGQLTSLLAGLDEVDDGRLEGLVVHLVDAPFVRPATVRALVKAWRTTRAPIVRPACEGRHGHPAIFDRGVFADLRAADPAAGAKAVFARHRHRLLDVEVDDPGAFDDIDTPAAFDAALSRWAESRARESA